jgi:rhodanese-related sulfurtransferase
MTSPTEITSQQLNRLIGTPTCPIILDVRIDEDFSLHPNLIPGSRRHNYNSVSDWAPDYLGQSVVISCHKGLKLSQGVAALLRHHGTDAQTLEGGHLGWLDAQLPLVPFTSLPEPDRKGQTLWVTRARPKIDRLACPWLIRRFIDRNAVFLFVSPGEVLNVADRFGATPFDIDGVFWSHRGETCTFDTMLMEFGLTTEPLARLATIVRGADTARLDLAPEAAGLLAISLGLSRQYKDDLEQLGAAMGVYDALYRWCRDATSETHDWPNTAGAA